MEGLQKKKKQNAFEKLQKNDLFFRSLAVQAKLNVIQPGDKYEQEADSVADQVIQRLSQSPSKQDSIANPEHANHRNPFFSSDLITRSLKTLNPSTSSNLQIQTKCETCGSEEKKATGEKEIKRKTDNQIVFQADINGIGTDSNLMTKQDNTETPTVTPKTTSQLFASKGKGDPLPKSTQSEMERGFGVDFSKVRTHNDSLAVDLSKNLGAQAFTHGSDIYFNSGKFDTYSQKGKRLLAHELTHVVQQWAGPQKAIQRQAIPQTKPLKSPRFKDDPVLEEVLNGKILLKNGESGDHITRLQQGLIDAGHELKEFGADGQFGGETKKEVIAFQEAHGLETDGVIGPNTMSALDLYLSMSPGPAPLPPEKGSTLEALKSLLAKGAAMTGDEAIQARDLLFQLNNDEFRIALKEAIANGSFMIVFGKLSLADMLKTSAGITREVVIPVTLLKPATDTVDADFRRANEIYNPHNLEIEKGNRMDIEEKDTKKIIGDDLILDEFTGADATKEELELIKHNRVKGRITGYWVPDMTSSRGEALDSSLGNMPNDRISVVINASSRAQDTFPHEVGHVLGLDHSLDPDNLMAGGDIRNIAGAGIDKLTAGQIATIRASLFIEIGKKGLSK